MIKKDLYASVRRLDRITDEVGSAPKTLTALYLLREAALRLTDPGYPGIPDRMLDRMLRRAQTGEADALTDNCHEAMFTLCAAGSPENADDLYRRVEALRLFRSYTDALMPMCGESETEALRSQRALLEETFEQALVRSRAARIGKLMELRARLNRSAVALQADVRAAAAREAELISRRELLEADAEKIREILSPRTELSPLTAFDPHEKESAACKETGRIEET